MLPPSANIFLGVLTSAQLGASFSKKLMLLSRYRVCLSEFARNSPML
ncbi:hypothetical protein L13192_02545 [Pyrenophora tritici-repentis]|uniref:Uncharacterized protein n=1 Tax=Pyrenophora tritici-repentis TaxID=45151 RepID=A0A922NPT3_9PLEO|nr:hypothetical protein Ptr86124_000183 [Pyrenophora tritici-repentis]KAI1675798.1 hypothetical protein L13192_02545 [Pyrenophora tritici-repentis]KAI1687032.1 hypothetical protein KJE20_00209 [Pyrenophora tritici-repentis]